MATTKGKKGTKVSDRQLKVTVQVGNGDHWQVVGTVPQSFLGDSRRIEIACRFSALNQKDPRGRWTKVGERQLKKLVAR